MRVCFFVCLLAEFVGIEDYSVLSMLSLLLAGSDSVQ